MTNGVPAPVPDEKGKSKKNQKKPIIKVIKSQQKKADTKK